MTSRKIPESAVENLVSDLEGKANVANTVTTNTNQTITGQKTFTTELLRKSTDIDVTSKATSTTYNALVRFRDKNNKELGAVNNAQMNGGNIRTVLEARNKDGYVPTIGVQAPYEGSTGGFGYAPNTPDNAPANAIVTKDKIANMVTTNTAQTITGFKTFNNSSGGNRTNIAIVTDDGMGNDANNKWAGSIQFKKGNMDVGFCEALRNRSNAAIAQLMAFNSVNGQNIFSWVRTVVESNGYAFATAPTPSAGSTGEEIVTARWFRQSGCTARTVIETYNNGSNWYRIWSDGWVEQGGVITATSNGTTINFLKPFRDANYVVLSSQMYRGYNNDAYNGNNEIGGIEPSRCVFYSGVAENTTQRWMAQGYVA